MVFDPSIGHFVSFQCHICKPRTVYPWLASENPEVEKRGPVVESLDGIQSKAFLNVIYIKTQKLKFVK